MTLETLEYALEVMTMVFSEILMLVVGTLVIRMYALALVTQLYFDEEKENRGRGDGCMHFVQAHSVQ